VGVFDAFNVISGGKDLVALVVCDGNIGDETCDQSGLQTSFSVGNAFPICFLPSKSAYMDFSHQKPRLSVNERAATDVP
jgi:hypothetical protein